ncbi:MAG: hypothetical protein KC708_04485 [Anaerolineae bacterium]|nr:hypothetical protein [Anaerolineae bacterium]
MNPLQQISELLEQREIKRAESLIAKSLRSVGESQTQGYIYLQRARLKLLTQRPEEALRDIEQAQALVDEITRESPQVRELLGDSLLMRYEMALVGFAEKSDLLKSQEHYLWIVETVPDYENLGWIYYQLGRIALILTKISEAIETLHQALFAPSAIPELTAYVYERLGFIAFYEQRDPVSADVLLTKALHTYPSYLPSQWVIQVLLLRARILMKTDLSKALSVSIEAASLTTSTTDKAILSGVLLHQSEILDAFGDRPSDVIDVIQRYLLLNKSPIGVDVTAARVYERLANAYMQVHAYESAIDAFSNALSFNPDNPWEHSLRYQIAVARYSLGNLPQARQILMDLVADDDIQPTDLRNAQSLLEQIDIVARS